MVYFLFLFFYQIFLWRWNLRLAHYFAIYFFVIWVVKHRFHLIGQLTNLGRASWSTNCSCMCGSGGSRPEAWAQVTSPHLAYFYMGVFVGNKIAKPGFTSLLRTGVFLCHIRGVCTQTPPLPRARCVLYNLKNGLVSIKQLTGSSDSFPKTMNSLFPLWLCDLWIKTQLWTSAVK